MGRELFDDQGFGNEAYCRTCVLYRDQRREASASCHCSVTMAKRKITSDGDKKVPPLPNVDVDADDSGSDDVRR